MYESLKPHNPCLKAPQINAHSCTNCTKSSAKDLKSCLYSSHVIVCSCTHGNSAPRHACFYVRNMHAQLHELQDENWKLEVYGELEALKQQLSSLNGLEGRLDASESIMDATEQQGRVMRVCL